MHCTRNFFWRLRRKEEWPHIVRMQQAQNAISFQSGSQTAQQLIIFFFSPALSRMTFSPYLQLFDLQLEDGSGSRTFPITVNHLDHCLKSETND